MTISIWRYSHLALAVSSFVFIVLASISGIILAFQPISEQLQPYHVVNLENVSLAETVQVFQNKYPEIIEIKTDANDFILASVFTESGDSLEGYFNPITAEYLGKEIKPSSFFQWVTNFHRSLFLKGIGRFFVGLCSFLLCLIAVSGTVLVIKRQQGLKRFFSKVINENFNQYWHVISGRLSLIPIIIITITGVYLSLEKFNVISKESISHSVDFENLKETPKTAVFNFDVFQETKLSQVNTLEFPFSSDIEDYFILKLADRELVINQFSGTILSEIENPKTETFSVLSFNLHTGKGSIVWSLILAIASANILFFVYSGFAMTIKRRKTKLKNRYKKEEADVVVLVGSENGSTLQFANQFYKALIKAGEKAFITELNAYCQYPNLSQLVVFSATYGLGEAPTNAQKFLSLVRNVKQSKEFTFSVIGFGSYAYPDFCQYAIEIDSALENTFRAKRNLPLTKVNDKSIESVEQFASTWSKTQNIELDMDLKEFHEPPKKLKQVKVIDKTNEEEQPDSTFLMTLKPEQKVSFTSGDLLAVYPENNQKERLYSIGKVNGNIQLSVKYYQDGLGSNFLNNFSKADSLKIKLIKNEGFHFPKKSSRVVLIANGTGIAPFLGMLDENTTSETHLYFGLRTKDSYALYQQQIEQLSNSGKLSKIELAFSREHNKNYVQDLLKRDSVFIAETLGSGGCLMICGSLNMQNSVFEVLTQIILEHNLESLETYRKNKQLKADCY